MHNSPSFNLLLEKVLHAEVRHVTVRTDRKEQRRLKAVLRQRRLDALLQQGISADMTTPLEPEDLNTDGIDFSGRDIWVHDCDVQNDDDSIAVKPCDSLNCQVADTHCTQVGFCSPSHRSVALQREPVQRGVVGDPRGMTAGRCACLSPTLEEEGEKGGWGGEEDRPGLVSHTGDRSPQSKTSW